MAQAQCHARSVVYPGFVMEFHTLRLSQSVRAGNQMYFVVSHVGCPFERPGLGQVNPHAYSRFRDAAPCLSRLPEAQKV